MRAIDIALKDIKQSFRSKSALVFMFVVPLLITAMFFLIFGSGDDEDSFSIATIPVTAANLDQDGEYGAELLENLKEEYFTDLISLSIVEDAGLAREMVDNQSAAVALIIPENFSAAVTGTESRAEIELYQDPTLTLGPSIVQLILSQFMDGYTGSRIAVDLSLGEKISSGEPISPEEINLVISSYLDQIQANAGTHGLVTVENPRGEVTENSFSTTSFIGFIMGGMMIFYAFFTGANTSMTILQEEEKGTLPRLFTTPTPQVTILNGKFIATAVTIAIQVLILLIFGWLVFGISWGSGASLAIIWLGITASAAGFGIFINSLLKDTKQASLVFGGVVTVTGMLGMSNIFVMGAPGASQLMDRIALFAPQGWAMRALQVSMDGANPAGVAPYIAVSLVWAGVLFLIGNARFKRRYA